MTMQGIHLTDIVAASDLILVPPKPVSNHKGANNSSGSKFKSNNSQSGSVKSLEVIENNIVVE